MKKTLTRTLVSALLCVGLLLPSLVGCTAAIKADNLMDGITANRVSGKSADEDFIQSSADFAVKLFQKSADGKNNIMISPLSVMLALAMTANGADGQTKSQAEALLSGGKSIDELNEYLYAYVKGLRSDRKSRLSIANSVWIKKDENFDVKKAFLQKNADWYNASMYRADFDNSTVSDINRWVDSNTDGMIKKMIDSLGKDTVMLLINAICFDAEWEEIYKDKDIKNGKFTDINGKKQDVSMMHSTESAYITLDNGVGFTKPYANGNYSFAALLPDENTDLADFIASLSGEKLIHALKTKKHATVYTAMPKFSFDYEKEMKDILIDLGMNDAFDRNRADFSGIGKYTDSNIFINKVLHKTFISVDAKGTRAGAATAVVLDKCSSAEATETYSVTLDRPFVFMIIDNKAELPIFIGALTQVK